MQSREGTFKAVLELVEALEPARRGDAWPKLMAYLAGAVSSAAADDATHDERTDGDVRLSEKVR